MSAVTHTVPEKEFRFSKANARQVTAAAATYLIPAAAAAALFTAWVAAPIAIGGVTSGLIRKFTSLKYASSVLTSFPVAVLGFAGSSLIQETYVPHIEISNRLDQLCWKEREKFIYEKNGEKFYVTMESIQTDRSTETTDRLGNSTLLNLKPHTQKDSTTHMLWARVDYEYTSIVNGKKIPHAVVSSSGRRDGPFEPDKKEFRNSKGRQIVCKSVR